MQHTQDKIVPVQALRFFAAALVLIHHCRSSATMFDGSINFLAFTKGPSGVDLFFVISGFIMVYVTHGTPVSPAHFILRRFLRVWPLYFVATVVGAYLTFFHSAYFKGWADAWYIVKSAFFIPAYREPDGAIYPLVLQGWTLNIEIIFYLAFGACLFARPNVLLASLVVAVVYLLSSAVGRSYAWSALYGGDGAIILEFIVGMAIGTSHVRGDRLSPPLSWFLIAAGVVLLLRENGGIRLLNSGIPAALILVGAINLPRTTDKRVAKIGNYLGDLSYPIYIVHVMVMSALYRILLETGVGKGELSGYVYILFVFIASMATAIMAHHLIERPIGRLISARLQRLQWYRQSVAVQHNPRAKAAG